MTVSPFSVASTSSISTSGVHFSVQASAHVASSCLSGCSVPKPTFKTLKRCRKKERFKSRKAAASDFTLRFSRRSKDMLSATSDRYFSSFKSRRFR